MLFADKKTDSFVISIQTSELTPRFKIFWPVEGSTVIYNVDSQTFLNVLLSIILIYVQNIKPHNTENKYLTQNVNAA